MFWDIEEEQPVAPVVVVQQTKTAANNVMNKIQENEFPTLATSKKGNLIVFLLEILFFFDVNLSKIFSRHRNIFF